MLEVASAFASWVARAVVLVAMLDVGIALWFDIIFCLVNCYPVADFVFAILIKSMSFRFCLEGCCAFVGLDLVVC
ncbi:hypothetical protein BSPWISOXPB_7347 [uncultured Gammaproteobacteria bacterium]|nr:hypothetical protein BSPWISOXPB_7347 [uncultured Gammaproteobacteria bacterium]